MADWQVKYFPDSDRTLWISEVDVDAGPDGQPVNYGGTVIEGTVVLESDEECEAAVGRLQRMVETHDELLRAAKALLDARSKRGPNIVGTHPKTGHPLDAEGMAAYRLEEVIARAALGE